MVDWLGCTSLAGWQTEHTVRYEGDHDTGLRETLT